MMTSVCSSVLLELIWKIGAGTYSCTGGTDLSTPTIALLDLPSPVEIQMCLMVSGAMYCVLELSWKNLIVKILINVHID